MLTITKIFTFCYGHQLCYPDKSLLENELAFGKCSNFHGHNAKLEVTVSAMDGLKDGMVINFVKLKEIVEDTVIDKLDHKLLNDILELPTSENLIKWIWDQLELTLEKEYVILEQLTLSETDSSYVTLRR